MSDSMMTKSPANLKTAEAENNQADKKIVNGHDKKTESKKRKAPAEKIEQSSSSGRSQNKMAEKEEAAQPVAKRRKAPDNAKKPAVEKASAEPPASDAEFGAGVGDKVSTILSHIPQKKKDTFKRGLMSAIDDFQKKFA